MNSYPLKQLQKLTLHQQHKIWLKRVSDHSSPIVWWLTGVFFFGGAAHQLLFPLNTLPVAAVAIFPSSLLLIWIIIISKPAAAEGAAEADKLLGANSLFVSAWELSFSAASVHGTGNLLLMRMEKMLPAWSEKLNQQPRHDIKPISLAMITLAFLGVFFLLMPTHVQTRDTSIFAASIPDQALQQRDDPGMTLSDLFTTTKKKSAATSEPYTNAEQRNHSQHFLNSAANEVSAIQAQNEPSSESEIRNHQSSTETKNQFITTPEGFISGTSASEGKKISAQSAGNDSAETSDKTLPKAEAFKQVRLIDISSDVESHAAAFDNTRAGKRLIISHSEAAIFRQVPDLHPQKISPGDSITASATLLSAEQRNIVEHYFKQLDKMNEANE